jgi:trehalose 6-phosphate synthase
VSRLFVISNRVAVPKARGAAGAQGGLAGALLAALHKSEGVWFGWSGQETENPSAEPEIITHDGVTTATIDLDPHDVEEYYNGYANSTLWPLFHYRLDLAQHEREFGKGYERVNDLFADAAAHLIEPEDLVWVHDYHFMPLGERLRAHGVRNRLGFFLHIPWPPARLLVSLPYHERLVRSLLHYDLIGFQCDEWLESFMHYCTKELGAEVDEAAGTVTLDGRTTIARAYPIGIDYELFTSYAETEEARDSERRIRESSRNRIAMIGVDRLDYSKGLPERLDGIARFFEGNPEWVSDLVFIQIAPPSREDIASYQRIRQTLEQKTGEINGAYSQIDRVPIRYVNRGHSAEELYGVYRGCRIGLVTPLRDGMNLVAKEYVASQDPEDPGVLILSRFAGAAQQLTDAVLVNPHSPDELAYAIKTALEMPLEERKRRWQSLVKSVREENISVWTANFSADLRSIGDNGR